MRYLRFTLFMFFAISFHIVIVPVFILMAWIFRADAPLYFIYGFFWRTSYWLLGIRFSVEGRENIPAPPLIITPNHQSYIDGPFFLAYFPYRIKAMIKNSIFRIPMIGQALKVANFIRVKRQSSLKASQSYLQAEKLLKRGEVLLIFPEGTRTRDGSLGKFREGACRLAARAGVPLLPVVFFNSRSLLPRDSWIPRPGEVKVKFLPPLPPASDSSKLCEKLRKTIENALAKN